MFSIRNFFDKLLGMNSDCYERKMEGYLSLVKNLDARYAYLENKKNNKFPEFKNYFN